MNVEQLQQQKAAVSDKHRFVKFRPIEGAWCVMKPSEYDAMTHGEGLQTYEVLDIWMTDAEFDALQEFGGW